jgi:hypothetical protein
VNARTPAFRGALEAIDRVLNRGSEPDIVLREVVAILRERAGYERVAILFAAAEPAGPAAGDPELERIEVPVRYRSRDVAVLQVGPPSGAEDELAFLERVATLISLHCLIGFERSEGDSWR